MSYTAHQLEQGTPDWDAHRKNHFNGSEAAAMLSLSPHMTRDELLKQKATGIVPEVDPVQQRLYDKGHAIEAAARTRAEQRIGDLYPMTASLEVDGLPLSSSYDGVTLDDFTTWECKMLNQKLAAALAAGEIPERYKPQLEQGLLIVGATRCQFTGGTEDGNGELSVWYESDPALRARLIAGWKQFAIDLANYQPTQAVAAVVAAPVESLPAVSVRLNGALAVTTNLPEIRVALHSFIERMVPRPETDQQFADAEAECKALKKAEDALEAAEAGALAELSDVDAMRRAIADLRALARSTRLAREKLVAAEKENRRQDIVAGGVKALRAHLDDLNKRLGKPFMPALAPVFTDFGGAIKGKKNLDSMQSAVNDLLAKAKIEANAIADRIDVNLRKLNEKPAMAFLFADQAQIVLKATDDFAALVENRIAAHEKAEADKLEAERARIRAEEQTRADREAQEKVVAAAEREKNEAFLAGAEQREQQRQAEIAGAVLAVRQASAVVPLRPVATTTAAAPTLRLGVINERLSPIQVTADGLAELGFKHAGTERASKLYHEHVFPLICAALVRHIEAVQAKQAA